jgi:WD40 repeat protein
MKAWLLVAIGCACGQATPAPLTTAVGVETSPREIVDNVRVVPATGHQGSIIRLVTTPDGRFIATLADDRIARVIQVDGMREVRRFFRPGKRAYELAIAADGLRIAVAYADATVVFDVGSGAELGRIPVESSAGNPAMGISGSHRCLAFTGSDLLFWRYGLLRWRSGAAVGRLWSSNHECARMGFLAPNLLVVDSDDKLHHGELSADGWVPVIGPKLRHPFSFAFGRALVAWSASDGVYTWRVGDPTPSLLAAAPMGAVGLVDDGAAVILSARVPEAMRIDVSTGSVSTFEHHYHVAPLAAGKAASADNTTVCVIDTSRGAVSTCVASTTGAVRSLAASDHGQIVVGAANAPLRVWSSGGLRTYASTSQPSREGIAASASDVVAQVGTGAILVRSLSSGVERELRHPTHPGFRGIAISPNGEISTTSGPDIIRFRADGTGHDVLTNILPRKPRYPSWAWEHGEPDAWVSFYWYSNSYRLMAYRSDAEVLAVTSYDKVLLVRRRKVVAILDRGGPPVTAIAFRPGTTELVAGFADGSVVSWNTDTPTTPIRERESNAAISAIAFDVTGTTLFVADDAARLRVYSADEIKPSRTIETNQTTALALAALPHGRIASGHVDGGVRIWKVATAELRAELYPLADSDWLVVSGRHFEIPKKSEHHVYGVRDGEVVPVVGRRRSGLLVNALIDR